MSGISKILKQAEQYDRNVAREMRVSVLDSILKNAQDFGLLQHFNSNPHVYETREHFQVGRGGELERDLYGVGLPDHKKTDLSVDEYSRSLSTRYSPDRVGVQARRIADGVYQDPITNKIYDWNEGFTTEDGETFNGGGVSLQTDIFNRS